MHALTSVLNPATRFVASLSQSRLLPVVCIVTGLAGSALRYPHAQKQETKLDHLVKFIELRAGIGRESSFGVLNALEIVSHRKSVIYGSSTEVVRDELEGFLEDVVASIDKIAKQTVSSDVQCRKARQLGTAITERVAQIESQLALIVEDKRQRYVTPALNAAQELQAAKEDRVPKLVMTFLETAGKDLQVYCDSSRKKKTSAGSLLEILNEGNPQPIELKRYLETGPDVSSVKAIRKGLNIQPNVWTPAIAGLTTAVALIGLRWLPVRKLSSLLTT